MLNADPIHFEVRYAFEISGRGVVLGGTILSGTIKVGMRLRFKRENAETLEAGIHGVEFIDHRREGTADIGLILDETDPDRRALWKQLGNAGFVGTVTPVPI